MSKAKSKHKSAQILLVDDSISMRKLLRAMIEADGYHNITEADHGVEAFKKIIEHEFHILLTDWKMEPMDGMELSRRVRHHHREEVSTMPIVLVTAFADQKLVAEARDLGINEVLSKPVAAKVIQSKLETLLTVHRPFIKSGNYTGPDRRRGRGQKFDGQERRRDNPPVLVQVQG
jgi:two-component system, chemotaxis family, chemotaxis protein CheY